jgi:type I restriction enzyme S subunit
MKQYEAYKDSGVDWMNEIPKTWDVIRLKYVSDNNPSNVDKKAEADEKPVLLCNYVDVYKNDYITNQISFMEATASEIQIEKFSLRKGFVIATKDSETPDDIANPAYVSEDLTNVVCGYHLTLMKPHEFKLDGKFLFNLFKSPRMNSFFEINARGVTRFGLPTSAFNDVYIPLPSYKEQTTIANYLDHKTSQLDTLITKKEKLIKLLQEERTAIINHAVTKGLDPNVPMKDSGIEWLGEIPQHWEVKKLKYLVHSVKTGNTPPSEVIEYFEPGDIDWFTPSDFKQLILSDSKRKISDKAIENGGCKIFPKYSVLLIGIGATLGKIGILIKPASSNQQINAIIFNDRLMNPFYGALFLNSFSEIVVSMASAATLAILNQTQTKDLFLVSPPIREQNEICEYVHQHEKRIESIILKTQQEIELLKEYKTALISEVVTGKVDVRNEVLN